MFKEFTNESGNKVCINTDFIVSIQEFDTEPYMGETLLIMSNGKILVKGNYDYILNKLNIKNEELNYVES